MRVHCAGCGNNHNISANVAGALLESAQRGEMHTVGSEKHHGTNVTQIHPRCLLKMTYEIQRSNRAGNDIPTGPLAS